MKSLALLVVLLDLTGLPFAFAKGAAAMSPELKILADSIALQKTAVDQLHQVNQKAKGTSERTASMVEREVEVLGRLAQAESEYANLASAQAGPEVSPNLVAYQSTLKALIRVATDYLTRFPNASGYQSVLLERGKTYQNLSAEALAAADFEQLAFGTKRNANALVGAVALIDLDYSKGRFENVVKSVDRLQIKGSERFFSEVQIKKAGALSKLDRDSDALKLIQAILPWMSKSYSMKAPNVGITVLREAFSIAIEVEVKGLSKKIEGLSLQQIVHFLSQNLPKKEVEFSPLENLAMQLIGKDQHAALNELDSYAKELVRGKGAAEALIRFQLLSLEHNLDQRLLSPASSMIKRLGEEIKGKDFPPKNADRLYRMLARNLENLRLNRVKLEGKAPEESLKEMDQFLIQGYTLASEIPGHPPQDDFPILFNLAEVAFRLGEFPTATQYYQRAASKKGNQADQKEIELKLISSRYQELLQKNVFPKDLKPISLSSDAMKKLTVDPLLAEWIEWLDRAKPTPAQLETLQKFKFESCRSLYANFDTQKGMDRLYLQVQAYPADSIALKSALLYFDTLLESKDWTQMEQRSQALRNQISKPDAKANSELLAKLKWYQVNASYQVLAARFLAKDYGSVMKLGPEHLSQHPDSIHRDEVNNMLGLSSVALGDRDQAKSYFSKLNLSKVSAQTKGVVLANEVDSNLEKLDFSGASGAYLSLIKSGSLTGDAEKNKAALTALDLAWVSEDSVLLNQVVEAVCSTPSSDAVLQSNCIDDSLWLELIKKGKPTARGIASRKGGTEFGRIILLLPKLRFSLLPLKEITENWQNLPSIRKTALIPFLDNALRAGIFAQREQIRKSSPIRLEKTAIEKRAKLLVEFEKGSEWIKKLDWIAMQYFYLKGAALAYQDFSRDIESIPAPKGFAEAEKQQFKQMISQNSAPFQKTALSYDAAAKGLNAKKAEGVDLERLVPEIGMVKPDQNYLSAVGIAVKNHQTILLSHLLDRANSKALVTEAGQKVQMAMILYLSGGFTESEHLFREAQATSVLPQFISVDEPVQSNAKVEAGK